MDGALTPSELQRRELFREVNARILEVIARFGTYAGRYDVLCECGANPCIAWVDVPADLYEDACTNGSRFVVVPGHERPAFERVVAEAPTFLLVAAERPALNAA